MDDRDPPQVRRREEAGRVTEGATTDRDDRLASRDVMPGKLAGSGLDDGQAFCRLALGEQDRRDGPPQRLEPCRDA